MILDYYDYIVGTKKSAPLKVEPYRCEKGEDKTIQEIFRTKSKTALDNLSKTNSVNAFYKSEPDIALYVPKECRAEYFYVMKSGLYSTDVPAKLLYVLKECFEQHGTYNMLAKYVPEKLMEEMTAENFMLNGKTILDVIKEAFDPNFEPISHDRPLVKNEDNFDLYVPDKDRILIIPPKIEKIISQMNYRDIKVTGSQIYCEGQLICRLGDFLGLYKSTYDYRDLV